MDRELDISRCWAVHSSSKRLFDPRDTDQAIGPFPIGKLARDGVEVPTSVVYGEYFSRPTNMTATPAPEQMSSPFRDRSALVIGVPLGRTDTHSSAPARLDLAVEAPTSVIYGENHSRPDQNDHSAAEQTTYVYPSELAARSSLVSLYGERAPHSSAPALLDLAVETPT